MHQSIPSANIPPWQTSGEFVRGSQKHGPRGKKTPTQGSNLEDLVSFPVNRRRNFGLLHKSNLEKNWKAVQLFFGHTL